MADRPQDPSERTRALRTLVINAMFSAFIAIVVFVVGTYFFIIPHLYDHERRLAAVETTVHQLAGDEETFDEEQDDAEDEPSEPGAANPAANAPAANANPATAGAPDGGK